MIFVYICVDLCLYLSLFNIRLSMNREKKAKDNRRNNIFAAAFDYLKRNTEIRTQQQLADKMGVTKDTISRIITAKTYVTEDAITKFQTATDCIFNLQWLRGESDTMLACDVEPNEHDTQSAPDLSSMTNAIIAAKDDAIEALKRELQKSEESFNSEIAAKNETISALHEQLSVKDDLISSLQQQVADLRSALAEQRARSVLADVPFHGTADCGSLRDKK